MIYHRDKLILIFFFLVYVMVGIGAHFFADRGRGIYPFFSWFLFVEIPPRIQTSFELFVTEFQGEPVFPAVPLKDLTSISLGMGNTKKFFYLLVDRLGRAIQDGNLKEVERIRVDLEAYLNGVSVYEVREINFNPVARFRSETVLSESSVGIFKTKI